MIINVGYLRLQKKFRIRNTCCFSTMFSRRRTMLLYTYVACLFET